MHRGRSTRLPCPSPPGREALLRLLLGLPRRHTERLERVPAQLHRHPARGQHRGLQAHGQALQGGPEEQQQARAAVQGSAPLALAQPLLLRGRGLQGASSGSG